MLHLALGLALLLGLAAPAPPPAAASSPPAAGRPVATPSATSTTTTTTTTPKGAAGPAIRPTATGTAKPRAAATATGTAGGQGASPATASPPPQSGLGELPWYPLLRYPLTDRMDLAVNLANGNLIAHATDLVVRGTGLDLVVDRYYNSLSDARGLFGTWTMGSGTDVRLLNPGTSSVTFVGPGGYQRAFTANGGGYTAPAGADATLVQNGDGSYTLTFQRTGERYQFGLLDDFYGQPWAVTADVDRDGNTIAYSYTNPATNKDAMLYYTVGEQLMTANNASTINATTALTYDQMNRLVDWKKTNAGNGALMSEFAYQYDAVGNRTSMNATGTLTTFAFNAANELTRATGVSSYTDYTYDANGNMLGNKSSQTGTGVTMTYNAKNQMASITDRNLNPIPLTYTGAGEAKLTAAGGSIGGRYTHSALGLMSAADGTGTTYYTRDPGGTLVGERTPAGTYYFLLDGEGSVVALEDPGTVVESHDYCPTGNDIGSTGSAPDLFRQGGGVYLSQINSYQTPNGWRNPDFGHNNHDSGTCLDIFSHEFCFDFHAIPGPGGSFTIGPDRFHGQDPDGGGGGGGGGGGVRAWGEPKDSPSVPDDYIVVRGGTSDLRPAGEVQPGVSASPIPEAQGPSVQRQYRHVREALAAWLRRSRRGEWA